MNVLIISQCSKSALVETRRILDQFAERKGSRTWQTAITQQGLDTLRQMLRKKAKRNTAVACHWIKSNNRTELLWIVGKASCFNETGSVPTDSTESDVLRSQDENLWHTVEDISLLAGISGLFHDFGKANKLFQEKLDPRKKSKLKKEPYRHEWVSLKLFEAFVGEKSDQEWLEKLAKITIDDEIEVLNRLRKIQDVQGKMSNPFSVLPELARAIGWLIVSHHHLPKFLEESGDPRKDNIDIWMTAKKEFNGSWNSKECKKSSEAELNALWDFPCGTPFLSKTWRDEAHKLAERALKRINFIKDWLIGEQADRFSSHIARMTLMLADHCYSALQPKESWQDGSYKAYANTDRQTGKLKQKLDEHNVGVGYNAVLLAKNLPKIRHTLPSITRHKGFKKRSENEKFRWQDKAYDLACGVRERSATHGFFGVNMASTGLGKTFANARIMYGLANEKLGCRFSVALGLRTLTLQTGNALRKRLSLANDDLAVLIGSQAVKQLHEYWSDEKNTICKAPGSESSEEFFSSQQYVRYDGPLDDGRLSRWLKQSPKLHQLVSAPVLVSTIDHLIPATEGQRGGKQIAPMLRLLTSDLVLDEPDDFDLADLPALARLINWAGMLGTRVLLSSATLPPALVEALFDAYLAGRKVYQQAVGEPNLVANICCAWFDEYDVKQSDHVSLDDFKQAHNNFIDRRVKKLSQSSPLRQAKLIPVLAISNKPTDVISAIAQTFWESFPQLHQEHHQVHPKSGQRASIGLVRMANIKPLVAVAEKLFTLPSPAGYRIHYVVYHSQYPMAARSFIENKLDTVLTRHDHNLIWEVDSIQKALADYSEENHIFIVLATPVAEVGRDHDYDWAIAEPSSMRSLIQLAGRIQRHRQQEPKSANLLILSKNYLALCEKSDEKKVAYTRPGFESESFRLESHDLSEILLEDQLKCINSIPRIQERSIPQPGKNLVDLEHGHLRAKLFGTEGNKIPFHASLWWLKNADWCFELQRHTPFRASGEDEQFVLYFEDEGDDAKFHFVDSIGALKESDCFRNLHLPAFAECVGCWFAYDFNQIITDLAENEGIELGDACKKFGEVRLRKDSCVWAYHPVLGIFDIPE